MPATGPITGTISFGGNLAFEDPTTDLNAKLSNGQTLGAFNNIRKRGGLDPATTVGAANILIAQRADSQAALAATTENAAYWAAHPDQEAAVLAQQSARQAQAVANLNVQMNAGTVAGQLAQGVEVYAHDLQPEDPGFNPKWTVHDDDLFNPNNVNNFEDANAGSIAPGWIVTAGPGTFFSPFQGEFATFPGSVQFDLMSWWFAQQFNPGPTPHWSNLVFGAEWDQQGSNVSAGCGGTWGRRDQKVTIALLQTFGDTNASNVPADVNHYDPAVIGKTTRQCFLEGYGYRFLHPGPSAGTIVLDVGAGIGLSALALLSGGIGVAGIAAAAAVAVGSAQKTIAAAQQNGITISADVENAARLFAYMQVPPAPPSSTNPLQGLMNAIAGASQPPPADGSAPPQQGQGSFDMSSLAMPILALGLAGAGLYLASKGGK